MSGSLKTNDLKITLHLINPVAQISGKILGLFLDDSEKIDMDKTIKPTCCEKTKAIFSCPCAFYNWGCKKDIEPCLQMTESFMSKDPSEIPGAEIQRFSTEVDTLGMIILKEDQSQKLKLSKVEELDETTSTEVLLCINDAPALIGPYKKLKDISTELNKFEFLNPTAKRTYLKCFPDLLKGYAISEQPGVIAGAGSIDVVIADGDGGGIRDSLLPAEEAMHL